MFLAGLREMCRNQQIDVYMKVRTETRAIDVICVIPFSLHLWQITQVLIQIILLITLNLTQYYGYNQLVECLLEEISIPSIATHLNNDLTCHT